MDKKIKIGVIGCGRIAQMMHLPYLLQLSSKFEIYSLCDISNTVVQEMGRRYKVPYDRCYTEMDAMLSDGELEAVVICTKDHYEPVIKAANAKKHILVEKPLAFNLRQADEMIAAAKANNVLMMVGYMKRYDPGFVYAFSKIKEMDINFARVHAYAGAFDITDDLYDFVKADDLSKEIIDQGAEDMKTAMLEQIGKENEGYLLNYNSYLGVVSHVTVLMRQLFGRGKLLFAKRSGQRHVLALYDCGPFVCTLESSMQPLHTWNEYIEVFSTNRNVRVSFTHPYLKNQSAKVEISEDVTGTKHFSDCTITPSHEESYLCEWLHFYDCVRNNQQPYTPAEDAREDIAIADEIIKMLIAQG